MKDLELKPFASCPKLLSLEVTHQKIRDIIEYLHSSWPYSWFDEGLQGQRIKAQDVLIVAKVIPEKTCWRHCQLRSKIKSEIIGWYKIYTSSWSFLWLDQDQREHVGRPLLTFIYLWWQRKSGSGFVEINEARGNSTEDLLTSGLVLHQFSKEIHNQGGITY